MTTPTRIPARTRTNVLFLTLTLMLAVIVTSAISSPALADPPCTLDSGFPTLTDPDPNPECQSSEPVYYEWLDAEPDWCTYVEGDEVDILIDAYNNFTPYAWYVTPASDPGRDGDWFVLNNPTNGCGLFQYPW